MFTSIYFSLASLQGLVSRTALEEALRAVFPLKTEERLKMLLEIAGRASSAKDASLIKYNTLFHQVCVMERGEVLIYVCRLMIKTHKTADNI